MAAAVPHRFIVVEGPIGVGKTSLARRLSQSLGGQLILEQAEQNPFLERFYKNPRAAAFQTQLFFLFQRARQLEDVRQEDLFGAVRVADYLLEKDRLFARVTLDDAEYALYERVYERVVVGCSQARSGRYLCKHRLMCWWTALPAGHPLRTAHRARLMEKLTQAYARFFHSYDASPLLIVNSAAIDPVNSESDYAQLFAEIAKVRRGRHFFNPWAAVCCRLVRTPLLSGTHAAPKPIPHAHVPVPMGVPRGRRAPRRMAADVGALPSATAMLRSQRS